MAERTYQFDWSESAPDASGRLGLLGLSSGLIIAATAHGDELELYKHFPEGSDWGWVLISSKVRILDRAEMGEPLEVLTWQARGTSPSVVRQYKLLRRLPNGQVQELAHANHSFVLFDRNRRRPVIVPRTLRERIARPPQDFQFNFDLKTQSAPAAEAHLEPAAQIVQIGPQDVDKNRHLTHTAYVRLLEEQIPTTVVRSSALIEMEINFKAEAHLGDQLQIVTLQRTSPALNIESKCEFSHVFNKINAGHTSSAIAQGTSRW